jgi:hypothetical protein
MPGLINSINTNIRVGVGTRLFDLAYLLGVSTLIPFGSALNSTFQSCRVLYCTVHSGIDRLFHALEAFPRSRNDA